MKTLYQGGIQIPGRDYFHCCFALSEIPSEDQIRGFLEMVSPFMAHWAEYMHPVKLKLIGENGYKRDNSEEGKIYLFSNETGEEFEMVFESRGRIMEEEINVGERLDRKIHKSLNEFVRDLVIERGKEFFNGLKSSYPQHLPKSFDEYISVHLQ